MIYPTVEFTNRWSDLRPLLLVHSDHLAGERERKGFTSFPGALSPSHGRGKLRLPRPAIDARASQICKRFGSPNDEDSCLNLLRVH